MCVKMGFDSEHKIQKERESVWINTPELKT